MKITLSVIIRKRYNNANDVRRAMEDEAHDECVREADFDAARSQSDMDQLHKQAPSHYMLTIRIHYGLP